MFGRRIFWVPNHLTLLTSYQLVIFQHSIPIHSGNADEKKECGYGMPVRMRSPLLSLTLRVTFTSVVVD